MQIGLGQSVSNLIYHFKSLLQTSVTRVLAGYKRRPSVYGRFEHTLGFLREDHKKWNKLPKGFDHERVLSSGSFKLLSLNRKFKALELLCGEVLKLGLGNWDFGYKSWPL